MPTLKKFHFLVSKYLFSLIFLLTASFNEAFCQIEALVKPEITMVGSVVSVKIVKDESERRVPKVFFDKNKIPVFNLSKEWYRSLIPLSADTKPGTYPLEILYKGKVKKINLIVQETKYPLQELTLRKEVAGLMATRIERALVAKALSRESSEKLWGGKFIFPSDARESTLYGVKRKVNGVITPDYFHKGLDFAAKFGSSVRAPADGKVILAGQESKGFVVNGNCIFLDHGHGVITGYLHLSSLLVKEGDFVKKGQIIGKVGSTGIASGPHLHWGLYVLGKTVDPIEWTNNIIE